MHWGAASRSGAGSLLGRQKCNQYVSFHARRRFNLPEALDFAEKPRHLRPPDFLVGHFASTMENHGANLVAFAEELDDLILANLEIVLRGGGAKLHFLQLRATAAFPLLVGSLVLLVLVFAVVGDLANRRIGRGRNFHQIQSTFPRQTDRLKRLHDAQLPAIFVNHPDFAGPNPLVDADPVRLPEIPLSDKNPLGKNKAPG